MTIPFCTLPRVNDVSSTVDNRRHQLAMAFLESVAKIERHFMLTWGDRQAQRRVVACEKYARALTRQSRKLRTLRLGRDSLRLLHSFIFIFGLGPVSKSTRNTDARWPCS